MNASDIEKTLTELLINTVDSVSEIDINMPLLHQGIDSLDLNSFFLEVETHFKIAIDDDRVAELDTIKKLSTFLSE